MVSYADFRHPPRPDSDREPSSGGCVLPVINAVKEEEYRAILETHAKALLSVRFGGFWEEIAEETPTSGYDKKYFIIKPAELGEGLALIKGNSPSEALEAMLEHPENWRLDCSAFTHVLLGLAHQQWVGKKTFDKKFKGRLFFFSQASDSFTRKGISFLREDPRYPLIMRSVDEKDCGQEYDKDEEALFKLCPVGTIFIFRNGDVHPLGKQNYRFEHTIRLGANSFVAHALMKEKNIVSLKELREGLASRTYMAYHMPGEDLANYSVRVIWLRAVLLLNTHFIED